MESDFIPSLDYTCRGMYFKPLHIKFKDTLVNFDDTLIKKVVREKFKTVSNFLTSAEQIANKKGASDDSGSETRSGASTPPRAPAPLASPQPNQEKTFYVKKLPQPDQYELIDEVDKKTYTACVNNMKTSKFLQDVFRNKTLMERVQCKCVFNEKFKKWMPVALSTTSTAS